MPEVEGVLGQLDAERGVDEPAHQRNGDGLDWICQLSRCMRGSTCREI